MKIDENSQIPKGQDFAPFLSHFIKSNDINVRKYAKALHCYIYTLKRLAEGKTLPTERAYAEFSISFIIISNKNFSSYEKLDPKERNEIVNRFIKGGGTALSIGGMIALLSTLGVTGLSAAGITSGLAAIGSIIGRGMLGGIGIMMAVPVVAFIGLSWLLKSKESEPSWLNSFEDSSDPKWEQLPYNSYRNK